MQPPRFKNVSLHMTKKYADKSEVILGEAGEIAPFNSCSL